VNTGLARHTVKTFIMHSARLHDHVFVSKRPFSEGQQGMKTLAALACSALVCISHGAPASAQFVPPNPPGIVSPGCAGDCTDPGFGQRLSGTLASGDMISERRIRTGVTALKVRNYDRAAHYLTLALEQRPDDAHLRYLAGAAHYFDGQHDAARALLTASLEAPEGLKEDEAALARQMLASLPRD
jgi:hypothetical protein